MKRQTLIVLSLMLVAAVASSAPRSLIRVPGSITENFVVGLYSVDVTVSFDTVENLTLLNLGMTASIVNPLDVPLLARLPASVSIPAAFPVKIDVTPPPIPLLGLAFEGVASVILDTEDLDYTPGTRLRLYCATSGGDFADITEEVSAGSYRVRGSRGEFSEFLIVLDERDPAGIVDTKFSRLTTLLTAHELSINATVYSTLSATLASASANWLAGDIDAAKSDVATFQSTVSGASAVEIPNRWQSTNDLTDVAGLLLAAAGTLHFSLEDARDTDADGVYDFADNCTQVANASQCDTNDDGYGNHCDADLDNNLIVNSFDLGLLRKNMGATGLNDADLNCNGIVNTFDLIRMRQSFGASPGPQSP